MRTGQGQGSKRIRDLRNMADCRCVQVFMFCVFTQIFLLCIAQNTHMKNVAQNKPCGISSTIRCSNDCSAALNGNPNIFFENNPNNCIHTTAADLSPFWWVNLGQKVTISMITIYGRIYFLDRMPCVNVFVDGALVKRFTDESGWTNYTYNIPVLGGGRVVNITKDCDSNGPWINMCEVQVWVCDDGWYDDCSKSCGQCDNNMSCDKVNGNCASCQTGFSPPLCQECADGWYGSDCSQTCGNCSSNSVCDKVTGRCASCQTGFSLPYCKAGMSCDNDKETVSVAGPVAGAAVGSGVFFFVMGIIVGWWLKKSRSQQPSARGCTSDEILMTSDAGTSRSTSRPEEKVDNTPDYTNIGYTTNIYDSLKAPDDSNTTAYTSLDFHTDVRR